MTRAAGTGTEENGKCELAPDAFFESVPIMSAAEVGADVLFTSAASVPVLEGANWVDGQHWSLRPSPPTRSAMFRGLHFLWIAC